MYNTESWIISKMFNIYRIILEIENIERFRSFRASLQNIFTKVWRKTSMNQSSTHNFETCGLRSEFFPDFFWWQWCGGRCGGRESDLDGRSAWAARLIQIFACCVEVDGMCVWGGHLFWLTERVCQWHRGHLELTLEWSVAGCDFVVVRQLICRSVCMFVEFYLLWWFCAVLVMGEFLFEVRSPDRRSTQNRV